MNIIKKLKSFFSKKESPQPEPVRKEQEAVSKVETQDNVVKQFQANCIFCKEPILETDRVKEVGGHPLHKRCSKKAIKGALEGKNIQEMFK